MLPLIRATPGSCIVNMSSGAGSLNANSNPAHPHRSIFGPVCPGSKTALNAVTLAMAIELEPEGIPVSAVSPGFISTNLNAFSGTDTVEQGAREAVRVALLGRDGPTGKFTRWQNASIPWHQLLRSKAPAPGTLHVLVSSQASTPALSPRPGCGGAGPGNGGYVANRAALDVRQRKL